VRTSEVRTNKNSRNQKEKEKNTEERLRTHKKLN
jgi:hypothetical protein